MGRYKVQSSEHLKDLLLSVASRIACLKLSLPIVWPLCLLCRQGQVCTYRSQWLPGKISTYGTERVSVHPQLWARACGPLGVAEKAHDLTRLFLET